MTILLMFACALFGALLYKISLQLKKKSLDRLAKEILQAAEQKALTLFENTQKEILAEEQRLKGKTAIRESNLRAKEEKCEKERKSLLEKLQAADVKEKSIRKKLFELEEKESELVKVLEKRAALTLEGAKEELVAQAKNESLHTLFTLMQKATAEAEAKATKILIETLNQLPQQQATSSFQLPDVDMKSKLIGRDGKNFKAFQEITGVQLLLDDSLLVIFSSFDAKRRMTAQMTLELLCKDARVSFQRIEEAWSTANDSLDERLLQYGMSAAKRADCANLHPEIVSLLGKMQLLTSSGQNLLEHSVEVSQIMHLIAFELGLDCKLARRIGLLHDIGKALPLDLAETHARRGYAFALQYGEEIKVANGIGAHHDEMKPETLEAMLCKPCDALSASRPLARSQNSEREIEIAKGFEAIATEFPGVQKAFAIQGATVLQVFVKPDLIDDSQAKLLAHEIAHKIRASHGAQRLVQVRILRELEAVVYTA